MNWFERRIEWVRSLDPLLVDSALAVLFAIVGVLSVFGQDTAGEDFREPNAVAVVLALVVSAPVAVRRRFPLGALTVAAIAILVHILADFPEGGLPIAVLFLTYTAGAWCGPRKAAVALGTILVAILVLGVAGSPGLDAVGVVSVMAQFTAALAIGVALRSRRAATEARVREAEERAEVERQSAARVIAEERLRIAQELHDVVAHSMSVIAVQAGVGAHVLDDRPEQARAALDAISSTSRGTLSEMRRLLGVLRDSEGARSHAPAPGLADLPQLVADVRNAGIPVTLCVEGSTDQHHAGVELSAYRIVQEALTNVIKHAGSPERVAVTVRHLPSAVAIEVVDDGRGLAARPRDVVVPVDGSGQGLVGMRERVELWGGELSVGPVAGGGYRVKALLPYGDAE